MKTTLLTCIMGFAAIFAAAQTYPDSTLHRSWNNNQWDSIDMVIERYDNARVITRTKRLFVSGQFVNDTRDSFVYSSNGKETARYNYFFASNYWKEGSVTLTRYNQLDIKTSSRLATPTGTLIAWIDSTWIYTDINDRPLEYLLLRPAGSSGPLVPQFKYTVNSFGPDNWPNSITYLQWNDNLFQWDSLTRRSEIKFQGGFDHNMNAATDYAEEIYNIGTTAWDTVNKVSSGYSSGKPRVLHYLRWNSGQWDTVHKLVYTYDFHDNLVSSMIYRYISAGNYKLIGGMRDSLVYNINSQITERFQMIYDDINEDWDNTESYHYYYTPFQGIGNVNASTAVIYPNPAGNQFTIENAAGAKLSIIDLQGRLLLETEIAASSQSVDISRLGVGLLLYQLQYANGNSQTGKLLHQ